MAKALRLPSRHFQYQFDKGGKEWLFRYDFLRNRPNEKPESHVHINGNLPDFFKLPEEKWTLKDVHFPVAKRVSIASVVRLLADDFKIPCNSTIEIELGGEKTESLWRLVLRESEKEGFF